VGVEAPHPNPLPRRGEGVINIAYVSEEDVFPAIRIFSVEDGKTWSITDGEHDDARPIWRNGRCD
jgi:hypothetical protein